MARKEKHGGLIAQFLEMFGMTPRVPSGPSGARVVDQLESSPPPPRCQSCHNPAQWDQLREKWTCPHHPQANLIESS